MPKGRNMILEIQERTGKLFSDILEEEYRNGQRNCDIALKYRIAQATINRYLHRIGELESPELYGKTYINKPRYLNKNRQKEIEQEYKLPFKEVLRYLRYVEKKNHEQIGCLLNCKADTVYRWMKKFDIVMAKDKAMEQAYETGRMNKAETQKKKINGYTRLYARGSSKEEFVRLNIKSYFEDKFNERFDFVIGFTNWNILGSLEIDIPIIILDNQTNKVFKFAIEYDNSHFHNELVNRHKKVLSETKGWKFINLYDDNLSTEELIAEINKINYIILSSIDFSN